jgi:anti-sigma-K factor RskA
MSSADREERAALQALGLLDEAARSELRQATDHDEATKQLVKDYADTAALLAYAAPVAEPPAHLKRDLLRRLPARKAELKLISFPAWIPYAIAACLMALAILQFRQVRALKAQLQTANETVNHLNETSALIGLRLAELEAKDAAYVSAKVIVAWDPYRHHGVVSIENLSAPPAGRDYQLWILDPSARAPLSAGLIRSQARSHTFGPNPLGTSNPGFAISLEPVGGSVAPTGPILFAVAPGQ